MQWKEYVPIIKTHIFNFIEMHSFYINGCRKNEHEQLRVNAFHGSSAIWHVQIEMALLSLKEFFFNPLETGDFGDI